jgi:hypothetical protein
VTQPGLEEFTAYLEEACQLARVEDIRAKAAERLIVISGAVAVEGSGSKASGDRGRFVGHDWMLSVIALTVE